MYLTLKTKIYASPSVSVHITYAKNKTEDCDGTGKCF